MRGGSGPPLHQDPHPARLPAHRPRHTVLGSLGKPQDLALTPPWVLGVVLGDPEPVPPPPAVSSSVRYR